jgi:Peptidase A4 family
VPAVTAGHGSTTGYGERQYAALGSISGGVQILAGTAGTISSSGVTSYYAWYQVIGGTADTHGEVRLTLTVRPGDLIGGGAFYFTANGSAQIGVCNFSTGAGCVNRTFASTAPSTGARWGIDRPGTLANFGTAQFNNGCWATTSGAPCSTTAASGATLQYMFYSLGRWDIFATPSALGSDGRSFSITYNAIMDDPCPTC